MQRSYRYTSATLFVGILSFVDILSFRAISLEMLTADVEVLIDAYPNTPQVSQGTTVVMVCHVSGVPCDTLVTYQWNCPTYGCGARGLQSDGNIVSRREKGNTIAIDVVNGTDSGDYTCEVRSSGRVLGTATYRISNIKVGLVLAGNNGMIPLNSFLTSNSSILSPFEGVAGEYIRCGSTGGQPGWYNEADVLVPMSTGNNHFNSAPDTGELWFNTMDRGAINREFKCSLQNGSLINSSSFVGYFFVHQNKLNGTPSTIITSTTARSITLSWSPVNKSNGYHVSYRREDLSISLPPTYIRSRWIQNISVTLQVLDLEPGASYRINVWNFQYIFPPDHKVSSPFEITVTTRESGPSAPRLLTVVRSTSTSVDLNWVPPRHPNGMIHYKIEYSTNETFVDSTIINTASNSTHHTMFFAPKFPWHYFRVVAVNTAGVGRSLSSNVVDICHGMEVDSNGRIVGIFFGGFGLSTGIATVVFILVFCNRRRKIDKLEEITNKSPVKPEESQHTDIEVTANPSYQSVVVTLDKQKDVYDSVDT